MGKADTSPEGVIAAAVTPRRAQEHSIDLGATLELIDFLGESGVNGIHLLGSTGEFVHFVPEDRSRMLDFAVKRSRVPILANVSHSTLDGAVAMAHEAAGSGVAGVLIMPPYYFRYSQEDVRTFCLRFGEAVAARLPVYLYNIPCFTTAIEPDTFGAIASSGCFAGIKDSSGSLDYFGQMRELRPDGFRVFIGNEAIYSCARSSGADGTISGIACAVPELMLALDAAIVAEGAATVDALNVRVRELMDWIARFPAPIAIKHAVQQRKIKAGVHAFPLDETTQRSLDEFGAWFRNWLGDVLKECKTVLKTLKRK